MGYANKICRICGQEFTPKSARQLDCRRPITKICVICGNEFSDICSLNSVRQTCSDECQRRFATLQAERKYGETVKVCELCGKEFRPRTNTQKFCDDTHYRKCVICGKEFPIDTSIRQSEWPRTCSHECAAKYRFRKGNPMHRQEGVISLAKARHTGTPQQLSEYMKFLKNPIEYLQVYCSSEKITLQELSNRFGVHTTTIGSFINRNKLQNYIKYDLSVMESSIVNLFKSACPDLLIIRHDRQQIKPYELDLYLPEYKIAIECNPTSTHNSTKGIYDNDGLHYRYHKMKSDLCEKQGIFLFHIFGYDWTNRRGIIESMLLNLIYKIPTIIYARKTEVREVDSITARQFLDENHRQGYANGKIRYGLYYNDELVSLMTFGKMRHTIGIDKSSLDDCYELVRFCNKINISVVGGASKLFKHFIKHNNPTRIRSFSDKAHTRGNLYTILGFTKIRESEPGYVWVDEITDIAYHRMNAQKSNIQKFLHDDTIDIDNLTEKQIMESHGYVQVYDCGTITWEWRK